MLSLFYGNMVNEFDPEFWGKIESIIAKQNNALIESIRQELQQVSGRINAVENKIRDIDVKTVDLDKRCVQLERKVRKNNIVVFGLEVTKHVDLSEFVVQKINELLDVNITVDDINNIYKPGNDVTNVKLPIVIEFRSFQLKNVVMKNLKKLKGKKVYISNDMCEEDRNTHTLLVKYMKKAIAGKHKAQIKGDKLIVNGMGYTLRQLESENFFVQPESNLESAAGRQKSGTLISDKQLLALGKTDISRSSSCSSDKDARDQEKKQLVRSDSCSSKDKTSTRSQKKNSTK